MIENQVSQIDIMPTIFDLLGLDLPSPVDGSSLLSLILGEADTFRAEAYSETSPAGWQALPGDDRRIWCVRTSGWKLILHQECPRGPQRLELYDLIQDPGEQHDRIDAEPKVAAELSAQLEAYVARSRGEE